MSVIKCVYRWPRRCSPSSPHFLLALFLSMSFWLCGRCPLYPHHHDSRWACCQRHLQLSPPFQFGAYVLCIPSNFSFGFNHCPEMVLTLRLELEGLNFKQFSQNRLKLKAWTLGSLIKITESFSLHTVNIFCEGNGFLRSNRATEIMCIIWSKKLCMPLLLHQEMCSKSRLRQLKVCHKF